MGLSFLMRLCFQSVACDRGGPIAESTAVVGSGFSSLYHATGRDAEKYMGHAEGALA